MGHFVYKYVLNNEIIYIGKCDTDLDTRLYQHGKIGDNIDSQGWNEINNSDIYFCRLANSIMSDVVESELIRRYRPKYNKAKMNTQWDGLHFPEPEWIPYKAQTKISDICNYKKIKQCYIDIHAIQISIMVVNTVIENTINGNVLLDEVSTIDGTNRTQSFSVEASFDIFYKDSLHFDYLGNSIDISYEYINRKAMLYFIKSLSTSKYDNFPSKFTKLNHIGILYDLNRENNNCKTVENWIDFFLQDLMQAKRFLRQEFLIKRNMLIDYKNYAVSAGFNMSQSFNDIISNKYLKYIWNLTKQTKEENKDVDRKCSTFHTNHRYLQNVPNINKIQRGYIAYNEIFARARKELDISELKILTLVLSSFVHSKNSDSTEIEVKKNDIEEYLGIQHSHHKKEILLKLADQLQKETKIYFELDDGFENGALFIYAALNKNVLKMKINPDYMPLFQGLSNYITLYSGDIAILTTNKSFFLYEYLRLHCDTRRDNTILLSTKQIKEIFNMKEKEYTSVNSHGEVHFNRSLFEKKVLDVVADDLSHCVALHLIPYENGQCYKKVKSGKSVQGYEFHYTFSTSVRSATGAELFNLQSDPRILKIANDIQKHSKKKESGTDVHIYGKDNVEEYNEKMAKAAAFEKLLENLSDCEKEIVNRHLTY